MILYIKDPKNSTEKLLGLVNELSKVAGYKINIQKSVAFVYANNELTEREINKTIPYTIASKRIKYLGIHLPKDVEDLYSENYDTEEDTNEQKDIPCSCRGRISIIKISILPKAIYRFSSIPIKIPMIYLTKLEQIFQKFIWNYKSLHIAMETLRKRKKLEKSRHLI